MCECTHAAHMLRLSATPTIALLSFTMLNVLLFFFFLFSYGISKVTGQSTVLLDILAAENLKTYVLHILHLPFDFSCTKSRIPKQQFLWLACNSSLLEADKDSCHSSRILQSTMSLFRDNQGKHRCSNFQFL